MYLSITRLLFYYIILSDLYHFDSKISASKANIYGENSRKYLKILQFIIKYLEYYSKF